MKRNEPPGKGRTAVTLMPKCPIPKLLPYNQLVKEINQIDIGRVYTIQEQFQEAIEDEKTQGCFRKLVEYLPCLANSISEKAERKPFSGLAKLKVLF